MVTHLVASTCLSACRHGALLVLLVVSLHIVPAGADAGDVEAIVVDCSLVGLLATPVRYDGLLVRTYGYLMSKFENQAIYLSDGDARNAVHINGVFLDSATEVVAARVEGYGGVTNTCISKVTLL